MSNQKVKIICGFAGIGKSHVAKRIAGVVDLESTPFNKNWDVYTDVAAHMASNGYVVLVACHKDLREAFARKGIPYIVALPRAAAKEEYLGRYVKRGNTAEFVAMMEKNFEKFIQEIEEGEPNLFYVSNYLGDSQMFPQLSNA